MAEGERTRVKERQKEGIIATLDKGIKFGRPKIEVGSNFKEVYGQWRDGKITAVKAMQLLGLKNNTFYRRVKDYKSKNQE